MATTKRTFTASTAPGRVGTGGHNGRRKAGLAASAALGFALLTIGLVGQGRQAGPPPAPAGAAPSAYTQQRFLAQNELPEGTLAAAPTYARQRFLEQNELPLDAPQVIVSTSAQRRFLEQNALPGDAPQASERDDPRVVPR
jgi:hypothetical protein